MDDIRKELQNIRQRLSNLESQLKENKQLCNTNNPSFVASLGSIGQTSHQNQDDVLSASSFHAQKSDIVLNGLKERASEGEFRQICLNCLLLLIINVVNILIRLVTTRYSCFNVDLSCCWPISFLKYLILTSSQNMAGHLWVKLISQLWKFNIFLSFFFQLIWTPLG